MSRTFSSSSLDAYCGLYGSEAKVLSFAITCTARPAAASLTRYLAKDAHGKEFLQLHHGERVFHAFPGSPSSPG